MAKLSLLCLALLVSQTVAFDFWTDFRVTWGPGPVGYYDRLPKNTIDATADGWLQRSTTCSNQGSFNGFQWHLPADDGITILFDVNGRAAGIQTLVPQSELLVPESTYRFDRVPLYQNHTYDGVVYFVLTAYFVDPRVICIPDNSDSPPQLIGKDSQVYFQTGPSPNFIRHAPKTRDAAIDLGWTRNSCIPGMGWHNFYEVERYESYNCDEVVPTCILYDEFDQMHGFCLTYQGVASSPRYEHPSAAGVAISLGNPPQCILDRTELLGATTFHVYFTNTPWNYGC